MKGCHPVFENLRQDLVVIFTTSLIITVSTISDYMVRLQRPKGFDIFDTETRELEFILNRNKYSIRFIMMK